MPCCAFAAFIVSQIVIAVGALRRPLRGSRSDARAAIRNDVVAWRLQTSRPVPPTPPALRRFSPRAVAIAAVVEAVLVFGAVHAARTHQTHTGHAHHVGDAR